MVADGSDIVAREDMCMASLCGGISLANAKLGAVHGFAGPIGGMFPSSPHGAVCAALIAGKASPSTPFLVHTPVVVLLALRLDR